MSNISNKTSVIGTINKLPIGESIKQQVSEVKSVGQRAKQSISNIRKLTF